MLIVAAGENMAKANGSEKCNAARWRSGTAQARGRNAAAGSSGWRQRIAKAAWRRHQLSNNGEMASMKAKIMSIINGKRSAICN